jgi:hypothetical protein
MGSTGLDLTYETGLAVFLKPNACKNGYNPVCCCKSCNFHGFFEEAFYDLKENKLIKRNPLKLTNYRIHF